jgi:hypothetical protein
MGQSRSRRSLAIDEEFGDRAGMASSYAQIGSLFSEAGDHTEAVGYTIRSLGLQFELQLPWSQRNFNLKLLGGQRAALGNAGFIETLAEYLDAESVQTVLQMIDDSERDQNADADPSK